MFTKLTSLCYNILPWCYLVSMVSVFFFFPKNYTEPFATIESLPLSEFTAMVLVFPIIEELYIRYWLYGKNNYFRMGFLVSFVLCVCSTIFFIFSEYLNYIQLRMILVCIASIGVIVAYYLQVNKYNIENIISFINSFNRSWITVIVMSFYFTIYHMNSLQDFNWRFIIAYSFFPFITVIARKYGITASILIHMINNAEIASKMLVTGNAGVAYYYATLFLTVLLIFTYMTYVRQLDKHNHVDMWKYFKTNIHMKG